MKKQLLTIIGYAIFIFIAGGLAYAGGETAKKIWPPTSIKLELIEPGWLPK